MLYERRLDVCDGERGAGPGHVGLRLVPNPDRNRFYNIELADDPRGRKREKTQIETRTNPATGETYWREAMLTSSNDSIPTPVVQKNRLLISGLMCELDANQPTAWVLWP